MQTFYRSNIIDSDHNALYSWSKNRIQNQNVVPYYEYCVCMNGTSSLRSHICRDSRCRHMRRCHDVDRWLVRTLCACVHHIRLHIYSKSNQTASAALQWVSNLDRKENYIWLIITAFDFFPLSGPSYYAWRLEVVEATSCSLKYMQLRTEGHARRTHAGMKAFSSGIHAARRHAAGT